MVTGEIVRHDTRSKAPCGIQGAAGEEDSYEFGDEERETNADGREVGGFVFFGCEHEDCEDEEGGEEHF